MSSLTLCLPSESIHYNHSSNCFDLILFLFLMELCCVSQPIAILTTSTASALLVLSLTFHFSSTHHWDHFWDASFFSKKHFLVCYSFNSFTIKQTAKRQIILLFSKFIRATCWSSRKTCSCFPWITCCWQIHNYSPAIYQVQIYICWTMVYISTSKPNLL